jgi:SAM-dependent methyltransferase
MASFKMPRPAVLTTGEIMTRLELLRSMFDNSGTGLEIGPQGNGIAPRRDGFNTKILDYIPADKLRVLHASTPEVKVHDIEEVDYVSGGKSLSEVIHEHGLFDYIIASHVIEHVPDFVGFLKDCEALLKPRGKLVLAVPDKRYCFDAFRPLTSVGDAIERHNNGGRHHSPSKILDYYSYAVHRDKQWIVWNPDCALPLSFIHSPDEAKRQYERARAADHYIDAHAWIFTPSSFRLLVNDLYELGQTCLRETTFALPPELKHYREFYCSLSATGNGPGVDRSTMMRDTLAESKAIF